MKTWLKKNWFKIGLLSVILLVIFITSRYYLVILPQHNRDSMLIEIIENYRQDCAKEYDEKLNIIENISKNATVEQIKTFLYGSGLTDLSGNFLDKDLIIKKCVDQKKQVFQE